MQRIRWYIVAVAAILGLVVLAACNGGGSSPNSTPDPLAGFPVTLQGAQGTSVTLDTPPERMVVLSPGHVEILFAIGAGTSVIAVDQNTDFPPEAAAIDTKLSGFQPSIEAIAALSPDLVIVSFAPDGFIDQLNILSIPVFFDEIDTKVTTVEGVFDSIAELGQATGRSAEASDVIAALSLRVDAVLAAVAEIERGPTVYHELDVFEGFFTISPDTFTGDLYAKLKAENITSSDEGLFPQLSQEAIIDRNPEVIVLADAAFGQTPEVVSGRPGWDTIDAVVNGRVYTIDPSLASRPGPRLVDALEQLARLIYPELFPAEGRRRCSACFGESASVLQMR